MRICVCGKKLVHVEFREVDYYYCNECKREYPAEAVEGAA